MQGVAGAWKLGGPQAASVLGARGGWEHAECGILLCVVLDLLTTDAE